jgi:cytochrome P450
MQLFDDLEDFGSFDDAVSGDVRDPYTELAQRRREGAVQRLDLSGMPHDESKPVFMVYRYDEIAQVLRDNATYSSSIIIAFFGDSLGKHVMLGMDEPEHRRYRSLVSAAFSQKALKRRQDELVARVANDLIDRFAGRGGADLVREFTFPTDADHRRPARPASRGLPHSSAGRSRCSASPSTGSARSPPPRR